MARLLCLFLVVLCLAACGEGTVSSSVPAQTQESSQVTGQEENAGAVTEPEEGTESEAAGESTEEVTESENTVEAGKEKAILKITVGEYELSAVLEQNRSAEEFRELLEKGPVTVTMEDYGGFEKVGPLGTTLPRSDQQITTEPGDVILYQGNQITIYYGTNSWNFTRLAKITDPTDLQAKLGEGTVQVTFSLESQDQ